MIVSAGEVSAAGLRPAGRLGGAARVARAGFYLAGAALCLLPASGFIATTDSGVSLAARFAVAGLFCVALVRPEDALLVCAGLVVLGGPLAIVLGCRHSLGEPLLLAFLGGWMVREALRPGPVIGRVERAIVTPALALAALVSASMLVEAIVDQAVADYPWPYIRHFVGAFVSSCVTGEFYPGSAAGAAMLEGIAAFVVAVILFTRHADLAKRTLGLVVIGGAAVGAFNVYRLAEASLAGEAPHDKLRWVLRMVRINWVFRDVNAAGSYLSMMALVTAGFVAVRRRLPWALVAMPILAGWYLTGSRMPLLAAPLAAIAILVGLRRGRRPWSWRSTVALALAIVATLGVLWWLLAYQQADRTLALTVQWRARLGRAAIRATTAHPLFGVGVGRYWAVSGDYMDVATRAAFPRENAHNNFLQILAELGITGLAAFVWLLSAAALRVRRALAASWDRLLLFAAAGMLTFVLTWFGGHPLLIREVSDAFWLVLAAIVGIALRLAAEPALRSARAPVCSTNGEAPPPRSLVATQDRGPARTRRRRLFWVAALVCLAVSIPIRAREVIRNEADLSRATLGFSEWRFDAQGVPYRTMTRRARFHVRGATCDIRLGMRVDPSATSPSAAVEIRVDGQTANRIVAIKDEWRSVHIVLHAGSDVRFRRIDLLARDEAVVRVSRTTTDCR